MDVLGHHLHRLDWLHEITDVLLVSSSLLDAQDVAADLVAKLDSAGLKAEEGSVTSVSLWCFSLNRHLESLARSNFVHDIDNLGRDIIAGSLKKLSSRGPGGLTIVAHPEGLAENITADDLVLVLEALPDEAS